jgi:drug/metabolite transporter (DMT)-like permease
LIVATIPVFLCISSAVVFKERLTILKVLGIMLSVTGAGVVISRGDVKGMAASGVGWGEVFVFGCVASWVVYSLVGKKVMRSLSPLASVLYASAAGTLMLAPLALANGMAEEVCGYSPAAWWGLLYLAILGTAIGFVWFYEGVKVIGPTRAGLFINFVPVSAVTCAFFVLGEPLTWSLLVGGMLVMGGVYLVNRTSGRLAAEDKKRV